MIAILILCVLTSFELEAWELSRSDHYDLLETWGIKSVIEYGRHKFEKKFREEPTITCASVYKTLETPFVAIILLNKSGALLCMGSIIDHYHILSARKCYEKIDTPDLKVLLGCYKAYWARDSQVLLVKRIIRHEYMVAILRLKKRIKFTQYIKAVKIPNSITARQLEFEKVYPPPYKVVGFEVDRFDVPGDLISKEKYYKVLQDDFVSFEECTKNFTKLILIKIVMFCTLGNATFCWGGLGSPVLKWMPEKNYYLQVGVVIDDNCTTTETGPFLVARTDSYSDWITENAYEGHKPT